MRVGEGVGSYLVWSMPELRGTDEKGEVGMLVERETVVTRLCLIQV